MSIKITAQPHEMIMMSLITLALTLSASATIAIILMTIS